MPSINAICFATPVKGIMELSSCIPQILVSSPVRQLIRGDILCNLACLHTEQMRKCLTIFRPLLTEQMQSAVSSELLQHRLDAACGDELIDTRLVPQQMLQTTCLPPDTAMP